MFSIIDNEIKVKIEILGGSPTPSAYSAFFGLSSSGVTTSSSSLNNPLFFDDLETSTSMLLDGAPDAFKQQILELDSLIATDPNLREGMYKALGVNNNEKYKAALTLSKINVEQDAVKKAALKNEFDSLPDPLKNTVQTKNYSSVSKQAEDINYDLSRLKINMPTSNIILPAPVQGTPLAPPPRPPLGAPMGPPDTTNVAKEIY